MRRMSFMLTEQRFVDGSKTVTRRLGWLTLKPGMRFMGVNKSQGLKKGEKSRQLGARIVVDTRREPLNAITDEDVAREGFPGKSAAWFVAMFSKAMKCTPATVVTRIEYRELTADETRTA